MGIIRSLSRKHPISIYFGLALAISWGGVLAAVGRDSFPATPEQVEAQAPLVFAVMLAGPSIAAVVLTGLVSGRRGFGELLSRLLKWRLGGRWYAAALLATPLVALATLLALLPISPAFLPGIFASDEKVSVLLMGLATGVAAGVFEELGWTGFAIPRLRQRFGVLAAGLILGLMWGAWHFILAFWASGSSSGTLSLSQFLPWVLYNVGLLPVYRVLMVWVYDRTGSLLLSMLMHGSLTGGLAMTLMPLDISGMPNLIWYLALIVVMWGIVAAVARTNPGQLGRQQPQRRAPKKQAEQGLKAG